MKLIKDLNFVKSSLKISNFLLWSAMLFLLVSLFFNLSFQDKRADLFALIAFVALSLGVFSKIFN